MQRICFCLQVKAGLLEEYAARHRAVWPEMLEALRAAGWRNYSLFLSPHGQLIGYLETTDFAAALSNMARTSVNERWQKEMAHYFEDTDGRDPDKQMEPLTEIFHLD